MIRICDKSGLVARTYNYNISSYFFFSTLYKTLVSQNLSPSKDRGAQILLVLKSEMKWSVMEVSEC